MKKNKKLISLLLIFVFLFTINLPVMAKNNSKIILFPTVDTEKIFKKVEYLALSDESDKIIIEGSKELDKELEMYNITIDKEKMKYKALKVTGEKFLRYKNKLQNDNLLEKNIFSIMSISYSGGVIATTDDPVGIDLTETKQKLYWSVQDGKSYYDSRTKSAWAACPCALGTHWYVTEDKYTGLTTIDGGRTIESSNYAAYYNYDFMDDDKRTDVTHSITIWGFNSGNFDYNVSWTRSGEASSLLDLDITIY